MSAVKTIRALMATLVLFVTLWHGSNGVVQISSQVRAQRSIYFHSREEPQNVGWNVRHIHRRHAQAVTVAVIADVTGSGLGDLADISVNWGTLSANPAGTSSAASQPKAGASSGPMPIMALKLPSGPGQPAEGAAGGRK